MADQADTTSRQTPDALTLPPPAVSGEGPKLHLAYLDGLRAVLALYVVLHHAYLTVWEGAHEPVGRVGAMTRWLDYGPFAVTVFILLSGFCLMLPVVRADGLLRGGAGLFMARRARRILPTYYAALGLSLLLIWTLIGQKTGTHWDCSVPVNARGLAAALLMLQDVIGRSQINHAFWSIAVEWKIYFFFPLLVLAWRKIGPLATTALAVAAGGAAHQAMYGSWLSGLTPHYLGLFALGMLGAALATSPSGKSQWVRRQRTAMTTVALACAAAVVWLCWCWSWEQRQAAIVLLDLLVAGVALPIMVMGAAPCDPAARLLSLRPLAWVGTFGYSLYLIHAPLLQVLWQYVLAPLHLKDSVTFALLAGLGTPLIVLATYLFFLAFERPFLTPRRARPRVVAQVSSP